MRLSSFRAGYALVELLVATAIAGLVCGTIVVTLVRQQRFHAAAGEMLSVRSELRDAAGILVSDIRAAATASYGLPLMTDSAIEMVTVIGSSVLCATPSGATLLLPPASLANGNTLTSILATPDIDDIAMLYGSPLNYPDSAKWETIGVVSFSSRSVAATCPASTGFTSTADASARGYSVTLASPPTAAVRKGAPVRFLRRVRYSLYRSSDSRWYLGYRRCLMSSPSSCDAVQPVSGPYNAYSPGSGSGLAFRYYDDTGTELTSESSGVTVARVDIVLRGATARAVSLAGDSRRMYRDSAIVSVSPRNRLR